MGIVTEAVGQNEEANDLIADIIEQKDDEEMSDSETSPLTSQLNSKTVNRITPPPPLVQTPLDKYLTFREPSPQPGTDQQIA